MSNAKHNFICNTTKKLSRRMHIAQFLYTYLHCEWFYLIFNNKMHFHAVVCIWIYTMLFEFMVLHIHSLTHSVHLFVYRFYLNKMSRRGFYWAYRFFFTFNLNIPFNKTDVLPSSMYGEVKLERKKLIQQVM